MMCAFKYPIMHADFPNLWVCDSLSVCVCAGMSVTGVCVCVPVCVAVTAVQRLLQAGNFSRTGLPVPVLSLNIFDAHTEAAGYVGRGAG